MSDKKLFLLDAYALIFRAYYAFIRNPIINSKGLNTSAMLGFTNTLIDVLENQKPTHIAVVFDHKSPTFREQEFDFYKANRDATPEDIKASEPWIRKIIDGFKIPILESAGYEADDVIGTLAKTAEKEGFEVFMMTPDKDFGQLVSENIKMYKPGRAGKPAEIMGVEEICEKYQIQRPEQVIDILGLMGDAVDNIPGVPGVGEKTAIKLVSLFGSVEGVYENTDQLKGKLKEKVEDNKDKAFISKKLATILLDAPVEFDPAKLILEELDREILANVFAELEFRTLGKRILGEDYSVGETGGQLGLFGGGEAVQHKKAIERNQTYICVDSNDKFDAMIDDLQNKDVMAFDTETTGLNPLTCELVGLSFSNEVDKGYYVPCPPDRGETMDVLKKLEVVFHNTKILKIGHNIKFDLKVLSNYDVEVADPIYDTMVAHYVAEVDKRHKMDILAENYLGYSPIPIEDLIGKKGKKQKSMRDVPLENITQYASEDADITFQLKSVTDRLIEEKESGKLLNEVELPLIKVLMSMECAGIRLDKGFLEDYSKTLTTEILEMRDGIFGHSGVEFNMESPRQLGDVLFEKMKIPYSGAKTKTGQYSTREEMLRTLINEHEIIPMILNYRELTKLKSTYVDALPLLVNPNTNKIHTTFNQTIAATGRLSSLNPNLQNIPIRTERGRKVRQAFIPHDDNHVLVSADYSQVELRIIAVISKDEGMIEAFRNGEDIHNSTAAKVFNVPLEEVTREMRRRAKAVNFGIAYGQSAFGLSQTLGIPRGEARDIIDNYFTQYPGIKTYMTETVDFAKAHGYVQTMLGRRRYLSNINSKNFVVRSQAERNAINSPIQGSAADMIKVAMINIHDRLGKEGVKSKMTLQVHDELIFDVLKEELETIKPIIEEEMRNAIPGLSVPIKVDMGEGKNWLEAH